LEHGAARVTPNDPEKTERTAPEGEGAVRVSLVNLGCPKNQVDAEVMLGQLAAAWHEIDPSDAIREAAIRFLRVHPLRAADALQLAAAFLAAERRPASLEMVTLDERMGLAAQKEGFAVISAAPAE